MLSHARLFKNLKNQLISTEMTVEGVTPPPRRLEEAREVLGWINARIGDLERELQALKTLRVLIASSIPGETQSMQDIESLPWRPFKDGGGEWIFEDEAGQELIELLSKQG